MKATGMVRRVDGLGRIVIPKEIRKVLKIKENEQVEINVLDDKIILNRYSILDDFHISLKNLIEVIKEIYQVDILITNLNQFKITSLEYMYLQNKELSTYLQTFILNREEVFELTPTKLSLSLNEEENNVSYHIKLIIQNGDLIGLLIFLKKDSWNLDDHILNLFQKFLEKSLE